MSIADIIQLSLLAAGLAAFLFGQIRRWAVANHYDRLAMVAGAAGNAAGGIRLALSELPPGADVVETRKALIQVAATQVLKEFDTSGPAIGATQAKVEKLISDQLVPSAVVAVQDLGGPNVDALKLARDAAGYLQSAASPRQVLQDVLKQVEQ